MSTILQQLLPTKINQFEHSKIFNSNFFCIESVEVVSRIFIIVALMTIQRTIPLRIVEHIQVSARIFIHATAPRSAQIMHILQMDRKVSTTIPRLRCCLHYRLDLYKNKCSLTCLFNNDTPSFPLLLSSLLNSRPFLSSPIFYMRFPTHICVFSSFS